MKLAIVGGVDKAARHRQPCLRDHRLQVKCIVTVVQSGTVTVIRALTA